METINKRIIFKSGDLCKICLTRVWYFKNQSYKIGNKEFITCPVCNNEIRIK